MNTPFYGDQAMLRGLTLTKDANLKVLLGRSTAAANSVSGLYGPTGAYQVPASKKFIFKSAVIYIITAATGNSRCSFGYGDNNVGYASGAVSPTNGVHMGGLSFTTPMVWATTTAGVFEFLIPWMEVPANKYPYFEAVPDSGFCNCGVTVYGYEVNA